MIVTTVHQIKLESTMIYDIMLVKIYDRCNVKRFRFGFLHLVITTNVWRAVHIFRYVRRHTRLFQQHHVTGSSTEGGVYLGSFCYCPLKGWDKIYQRSIG